MENKVLNDKCRRIGCDRVVRKKDRHGLCHICWMYYTVEGKLLNRKQSKASWDKTKLDNLRQVIKEKRRERITSHDNS